jgi:hypothetical protein
MIVIRRAVALLWSAINRAISALHWALPGGPGRPYPWAELDDLEAMRRRKREIWRQGVDEK